MTELRRDAITGNWVVIATERGKRPMDFARPDEIRRSGPCPFCYGNEGMTPPEVLAYRNGSAPNSPGWSVRVVPNKFPALSREIEKGEIENEGPYLHAPGAGGHEVLVESPRHDSTLGSHPLDQVELVLKAIKERILAYAEDPRIEYVQVFKNSGAAAGASLEHTHFQIIATPMVPGIIEAEMKVLRKADPLTSDGKSCLLCEVIRFESDRKERTIRDFGDFVVFCPYASRFPYESWIVPREHVGHFHETPERLVRSLAEALRDAVGRYESSFENPPYNLILHTAPFRARSGDFHWHIEILPRLAMAAGFEWATGWFINPTPPEMAAKVLREAVPIGVHVEKGVGREAFREGGVAT